MRRRRILVVILGMLGCVWRTPAQVESPTLPKVKGYDLPGPPGKRFDYLTIDTDDAYLISVHLAANQTYVIDLRADKVIATVTDTPGAEGVEYVPGQEVLHIERR
jgi:hypothetical protein